MAPHRSSDAVHSPTVFVALVLVTLLAAGGGVGLGSHAGKAAGPVASAGALRSAANAPMGSGASTGSSVRSHVLDTLRSDRIPMHDVYLPNFGLAPPRVGQVVSPSYHRSPAPIGVASYGVNNSTGTPVASVLDTSSFVGSTTFTNLTAFYLDDDSPWYVGEQLNTVLSNVTLFGTNGYSFWTQNVVMYSAQDNLLQFIDNVWNFSSPAFDMTSNVFNSTGPQGHLVAPVFYYGLGPVMNISMPFTLNLYVNASTTSVGGYPDDISWFNYSVVKAGKSVASGSYDHVVFNSQPATPSGSIASPMYQVNGAHVTPTGFIPWDAELVLCGPGGGSTTSIYDLNATMTLAYWNGSTSSYRTVPDAWNVGSETGETIEGVTTYYDAKDVVHLGPGPTLLNPMWEASPTSEVGWKALHATIVPSSGFIFINASKTFDGTLAAWAPVPPDGKATYRLPLGNYSGLAELSNYDPVPFAVRANNPSTWTQNLTLTLNTSRGIYTPLFAWGNSQLAGISRSGAGTLAHPYVLANTQPLPLGPLFASFNDFFFPVFPGILLLDTSAHVEVLQPPTFLVRYGGPELRDTQNSGLPSTNSLQIELFGTTNVSVYDAAQITGWFSNTLAGFPMANLLVWNSSGDLFGANVFDGEGSSMLLFDGGHNVIWGNRFAGTTVPSTGVLNAARPVGLQLYGDNDTVYNNAFTVADPAQSPSTTIFVETFYESNSARWVDAWNLSARPSWQPWVVDGLTLSGSIVGGNAQGGNYWANYGGAGNPLGRLPYNNTGEIALGGDQLPLLYGATSTTQSVTFASAGAPPGLNWTVTVNGYGQNATTGTPTVFSVINGTYSYSIAPPAGYAAEPSNGNVTVSGRPAWVNITFAAIPPPTPPEYLVTFQEIGGNASAGFSVTFNSTTLPTLSGYATVPAANGTYPYSVSVAAGWTATPRGGSVVVAGRPVVVNVSVAPVPPTLYTVTFNGVGAPVGTTWSVTLNGVTRSGGGPFAYAVANGSYTYSIGGIPTGWRATPSSGSIPIAGSGASVSVLFSPLPHPGAPTFPVSVSERGLPALATWSVGLNGSTRTTNQSQVIVWLANGSYPYSVSGVAGYSVSPASGTIPVAGAAAGVLVTFTPARGWVNITVTTVVPGLAVDIGGNASALHAGVASVPLGPGVYAVSVTAPGYVPYFNNVSVAPGRAVGVTVALVPTAGTTATGTGSGSGMSAAGWAAIGILAVLSAVLAAALVLDRRGRGGGGRSAMRAPSPTQPPTPPGSPPRPGPGPEWREE